MAGPITNDIVDNRFIYRDTPGSAFDTVVYLVDEGYSPISQSQYINRSTGLDAMGVQISTVDEYLANNPQLKGRSGARGLVEVFINEWIKTGSAELAEDAMYKHILCDVMSSRRGVSVGAMRYYKKDKFAAVRKAKLRLSNIKIEEITQILRGKSKWIKH